MRTVPYIKTFKFQNVNEKLASKLGNRCINRCIKNAVFFYLISTSRGQLQYFVVLLNNQSIA